MRYTTPYYTSNYYTFVEAENVPILLDGVALDLRIVTTAGQLVAGHMLGAESALHGILTDSGDLTLGNNLSGIVRELRYMAATGSLQHGTMIPVVLDGLTLELRTATDSGAVTVGQSLSADPWTARLLADLGVDTRGHNLTGQELDLYLLAETGSMWSLLVVPVCRPASRSLTETLTSRSLTETLTSRNPC